MVQFQGFQTKAKAVNYQKKHGGLLCHKDKYSRTKRDYEAAVIFGGLDEKKYPYCVQWNERG